MTDNSSVKVGVLSLHNSRETKALLNTIEALGHEPVWIREENFTIMTENSEEDNKSITLNPDVDVILNRLLLTRYSQPLEDIGLLYSIEQDYPLLNNPTAVIKSLHKFTAQSILEGENIDTPRTALGIGSKRIEKLFDESLDGEEGVFKYPISTHGDGTTKIKNNELVPQLYGDHQGMIQELVELSGKKHNDTRVYVVGNKAVGAMRRYAPDDDWRTNVARGGDVENVTHELSDEDYKVAVDAANAIGLDYAGVDMLKNEDGNWVVLEVNPTAGFKGFFSATNINPAPIIVQHGLKKIDIDVKEKEVSNLMDSLDGSIPACKPDIDLPPVPSDSIIGYTEQVQVAGLEDSKIVTAKSDTGTSKTCIDVELAKEIGAGPIKNVKKVKENGNVTRNPSVDINIRVDDYTHNIEVVVQDREFSDYPVLLGRDILNYYSINIRKKDD